MTPVLDTYVVVVVVDGVVATGGATEALSDDNVCLLPPSPPPAEDEIELRDPRLEDNRSGECVLGFPSTTSTTPGSTRKVHSVRVQPLKLGSSGNIHVYANARNGGAIFGLVPVSPRFVRLQLASLLCGYWCDATMIGVLLIEERCNRGNLIAIGQGRKL